MIESTGVRAFGVHGRTKEERPNNEVHLDIIKEVVKVDRCKTHRFNTLPSHSSSLKHATIPVIANGGSSNNRNSERNTYEGMTEFWKETGASSVMIARAAEWNPSVFRRDGKKATVMEMVHKYER